MVISKPKATIGAVIGIATLGVVRIVSCDEPAPAIPTGFLPAWVQYNDGTTKMTIAWKGTYGSWNCKNYSDGRRWIRDKGGSLKNLPDMDKILDVWNIKNWRYDYNLLPSRHPDGSAKKVVIYVTPNDMGIGEMDQDVVRCWPKIKGRIIESYDPNIGIPGVYMDISPWVDPNLNI